MSLTDHKKPHLLVAGSLVMDLIVRMERFPSEGETVSGTSFSTAPGGKGANQAVQAARLGADVSFFGKVGQDAFGRQILNSMKQAGVDVSRVITEPAVSTAVGNVQLEESLERTANRICVVPGANMRITADEAAFLQEEISEYDMVLLQLEIPMEINCLIAEFAFQKKIPVMMNAAPYVPMPDNLLRCLTYLSPNEHEAADMSGVPVTDMSSARVAASRIREKGVKNVLITLGRHGAVYDDGSQFIYSPAVTDVKAVDPTAAGDSFVAAFCTAVCEGLSLQQALAFANQTAAITVTGIGALPSLPDRLHVLEAFKRRGASAGIPRNVKEENGL